MLETFDDDVPKVPDPWADDWASAQARRAVRQLMHEQQEPINPLPVTIH